MYFVRLDLVTNSRSASSSSSLLCFGSHLDYIKIRLGRLRQFATKTLENINKTRLLSTDAREEENAPGNRRIGSRPRRCYGAAGHKLYLGFRDHVWLDRARLALWRVRLYLMRHRPLKKPGRIKVVTCLMGLDPETSGGAYVVPPAKSEMISVSRPDLWLSPKETSV